MKYRLCVRRESLDLHNVFTSVRLLWTSELDVLAYDFSPAPNWCVCMCVRTAFVRLMIINAPRPWPEFDSLLP